MRVRTPTKRGRERFDEPRVDGDPFAGGTVEPRQITVRVEAREDALAGRDLGLRCVERATGEEDVVRSRGCGDAADRAHGTERLAL